MQHEEFQQPRPQRLIVPDLARGTALLGIAMANAAQAWMVGGADDPAYPGWSVGGVRPGSVIDQICAVFAAMFVHVRGLPMFSTLLGFGFGLVVSSLWRKGYPERDARRVLMRRYGILALFGLAHMFLVFYGDIMLTYGLAGLVLAAMLAMKPKILRLVAHCVLAVFVLFGAASALAALFIEFDMGGLELTPTAELTSLGAYFGSNFLLGVFMLSAQPLAVLQISALAAIGYLWAQEQVLIDVTRNRKTLTTWVWIAAAIILLIGLPWGLTCIGVLPSEWESAFYLLNSALGMYTGPGILAAIALATHSLNNEVPGWAKPFVALGQRSMSGYLAQSFLFIALAMPFTFGLGADATVSGKLGMGLLVWVITLVLAVALDAAGKQGPFEWAHRHLSYGSTGRIEPKHEHPAEITR